MSQRSGQKTASRQAIIASAAEVLRERGAAGTSVQAAMAGAGLTVGAFYAHFPDKAALLSAALDQAMDDTQALVDEAAAGQRGVEALQAVLAQYLSAQHRDDVRHGCPLPSVMGEAATIEGSALQPRLAQALTTLQRRLSAVAPEGLDAEHALALVALMVGGQILARATRSSPLSNRVLAAARQAGAELIAGAGRGTP